MSISRPVPTVTVTEQIVEVVVMPVTFETDESAPIFPPGILLLFVALTESPEEIVPGNATRVRAIDVLFSRGKIGETAWRSSSPEPKEYRWTSMRTSTD